MKIRFARLGRVRLAAALAGSPSLLLVVVCLVAIPARAQVAPDGVVKPPAALPALRDPGQPPAAMPQASRPYWAPLGLPRLRNAVLAGDAAPLARTAFEVDALNPSAAGGRASERDGLKVLELDADAAWSRPLRVDGQVAFVSINVYASVGTLIRVGRVSLLVADGPIANTASLLRVNEEDPKGGWTPTGLHVAMDIYGGKLLAALPVLTIRCDPSAGKWDLFAGAQKRLSQLPFAGATSAHAPSIEIVAGEGGAWLTGLVQASENPLFADANRNGIDDDAESAAAAVAAQERAPGARRRSAFAPMPRALVGEHVKPDRLKARRGEPAPAPAGSANTTN